LPIAADLLMSRKTIGIKQLHTDRTENQGLASGKTGAVTPMMAGRLYEGGRLEPSRTYAGSYAAL
jgi:hypothetical protein